MFRSDDGTDNIITALSLTEVLKLLVSLAKSQRKRYAYKTAEPTYKDCCGVCGMGLTKYVCLCSIQAPTYVLKLSPDRVDSHLLQCAHQRRINREREHIAAQFLRIHTCLWNDCYYRFNGKTCGSNSRHVTEHLEQSRLHQCLWADCYEILESHEDPAYHVSEKHCVPNEWTTLTKMHYCYEHDV
jgi:hypothetical protein